MRYCSCIKMVLDKVVNLKEFWWPNKEIKYFSRTSTNSRSYQDNYLNSRPFEDCTNHDYFFFDAFLPLPSTVVVFDVWLSSIAQKYANLSRTMKELQLLQSFDHFQIFLFYYLKELFCFTWQYELSYHTTMIMRVLQ